MTCVIGEPAEHSEKEAWRCSAGREEGEATVELGGVPDGVKALDDHAARIGQEERWLVGHADCGDCRSDVDPSVVGEHFGVHVGDLVTEQFAAGNQCIERRCATAG